MSEVHLKTDIVALMVWSYDVQINDWREKEKSERRSSMPFVSKIRLIAHSKVCNNTMRVCFEPRECSLRSGAKASTFTPRVEKGPRNIDHEQRDNVTTCGFVSQTRHHCPSKALKYREHNYMCGKIKFLDTAKPIDAVFSLRRNVGGCL